MYLYPRLNPHDIFHRKLHLGIYVVGPGDCGPEPSWWASLEIAEIEMGRLKHHRDFSWHLMGDS